MPRVDVKETMGDGDDFVVLVNADVDDAESELDAKRLPPKLRYQRSLRYIVPVLE